MSQSSVRQKPSTPASSLLPLLLLCSCSMTKTDVMFHTVNALDAYQTIRIGKVHPCLHEATFPTQQVLGEAPEAKETIIYFALVSAGYQWLVNRYSDRDWIKPFQYLARSSKSASVINNQILYLFDCTAYSFLTPFFAFQYDSKYFLCLFCC